jgi:hypothetical protein
MNSKQFLYVWLLMTIWYFRVTFSGVGFVVIGRGWVVISPFRRLLYIRSSGIYLATETSLSVVDSSVKEGGSVETNEPQQKRIREQIWMILVLLYIIWSKRVFTHLPSYFCGIFFYSMKELLMCPWRLMHILRCLNPAFQRFWVHHQLSWMPPQIL